MDAIKYVDLIEVSQGFFWGLFPNKNEKHLVHADFDPANILIAKEGSDWNVSGVLDWEFSFSGSIL